MFISVRLAGAVLAEQAVDLARLDVRSMWSLAMNDPNRLVIPRISSFIALLRTCDSRLAAARRTSRA